MRIAVITPALAGRLDMLQEAMECVRGQTLQPFLHLVGLDYERAGLSEMLNRLAGAAISSGAEWVIQLDDDDLLDPCHLQTLAAETPAADIVYSYCRVVGRDWDPNSPFDPDRLLRENYIPSNALIRASLLAELDGWKGDRGHEDWDLWLRALHSGARFVSVPAVTWTYRFHGDNMSLVRSDAHTPYLL
jgi:glycosyltransferase involved in cell wall biosynthesis